jgi:hypothetical protein
MSPGGPQETAPKLTNCSRWNFIRLTLNVVQRFDFGLICFILRATLFKGSMHIVLHYTGHFNPLTDVDETSNMVLP